MMAFLSSLLRVLVSWSYLGLVAIAFLPVMLVLLPSRRLRICALNVFGRLTGGVMIFFTGATLPPGIGERLRARHPAIFVSNHTSYLDNFLAAWATPVGTLGTAKASTVWVPFFGQLYALSGNVRVKREDRREAVAALRALTELLQRHRLSVMLWPEGTRSPDGRLQPFKRGFVHLALATRLPVVPIVVSRAHRCWPRGAFITRAGEVDVRVLDPIPTTDWTAQTIPQHVADVRARFVAALPGDQRPAGEPVTPVFQQ
jgi:lysophosphatidate acyltransferase